MTPKQLTDYLWVQALLKFAMDKGYPQAAALIEALPDATVVKWVKDRKAHPLPKWVKKHLEALNAERKAPEQREMLLPIGEKPRPGAEGGERVELVIIEHAELAYQRAKMI